MHFFESRRGFDGPYEDPHIYIIQGIVTPDDEANLGNNFLGTWLEGETSFLFFCASSKQEVEDLLHCRTSLSLFEEHCFSFEEWQGTRLEPFRIDPLLIRAPWSELVEKECFRKIPWLILSGLMASRARDIKERLEQGGLKIIKEWDGEGTWVTLLVTRSEK